MTMKLMMYIGNDLIESVSLDIERISKPGYLGKFKRTMKVKFSEQIQQSGVNPEFLVSVPIPQQFSNPGNITSP